MEKTIHGKSVTFDGDYKERVIMKPFANTTRRVPFIKLDAVYIYFPSEDEIVISKEDINAF